MPLPKGANDPAVRAAWIAVRRPIIAEYDRLVAGGLPLKTAARSVGRPVGSIERMRASVERMESVERIGRASGTAIDLGLALLSLVAKPNEPLTQEDIAAWCGCSRSAIYMIEMRALRKFRRRLVALCGPEIMEQISVVMGGKEHVLP